MTLVRDAGTRTCKGRETVKRQAMRRLLGATRRLRAKPCAQAALAACGRGTSGRGRIRSSRGPGASRANSSFRRRGGFRVAQQAVTRRLRVAGDASRTGAGILASDAAQFAASCRSRSGAGDCADSLPSLLVHEAFSPRRPVSDLTGTAHAEPAWALRGSAGCGPAGPCGSPGDTAPTAHSVPRL